MKKFLIFLLSALIVVLSAYILYDFFPPSKSKVEGIIYRQAAVLLSYKNTNNPLINTLVNNADVKVEKIEKDKNGYVAICKIGNHNFQAAYDECMRREYTSTLLGFTDDFVKILNSQEVIYSSIQVTITKNADGVYHAELTEEDIDAFTGGFITFSAAYYNK